MTLHTTLKTIFETAYEQQTEQAYYWTAKDGANLKQLIRKITFSFKERYKFDPKDSGIETSFRIIIDNLPQWYKEKCFTIPAINSHYNEIIQQIKTNVSKRNYYNDLAERTRQVRDQTGK